MGDDRSRRHGGRWRIRLPRSRSLSVAGGVGVGGGRGIAAAGCSTLLCMQGWFGSLGAHKNSCDAAGWSPSWPRLRLDVYALLQLSPPRQAQASPRPGTQDVADVSPDSAAPGEHLDLDRGPGTSHSHWVDLDHMEPGITESGPTRARSGPSSTHSGRISCLGATAIARR